MECVVSDALVDTLREENALAILAKKENGKNRTVGEKKAKDEEEKMKETEIRRN